MEARGQTVEVSTLLQPYSSRDQAQAIELGGKCFYLLSHLRICCYCCTCFTCVINLPAVLFVSLIFIFQAA